MSHVADGECDCANKLDHPSWPPVAPCHRYNTGGDAYALREVFLRRNPHRRDYLRARRGDRPRPGSQAEEKALEEVPRTIRAHTPVDRGEDPLEMPAPRDRHWHRRAAGHERSKAGSQTPQNRI